MGIEGLSDRKKRLIYRAEHRGTKEMDWLLGRFVRSDIATFDEETVAQIEALLEQPDRELECWIMRQDDDIKPEFTALIERIKKFHDI